VLLEMLPGYQKYADYLSLLYFKTPDNNLVPLASLAKIRTNAGPQSVNHSGSFRRLRFRSILKPGVALGDAVDEVESTAERVLPAILRQAFKAPPKRFRIH